MARYTYRHPAIIVEALKVSLLKIAVNLVRVCE